MKISSKESGFTLLELLLSVAIFALISAATFMMLQQTLKTREVFDDKSSELSNLQHFYRVLQRDVSQIVLRRIRNEYGEERTALISEEAGWGSAIEMTRTGRSNPLNRPRSDMQRIRYFFDGKNLVRRSWKSLDRAPEVDFYEQQILTEVKAWKIRFLVEDEWHDQWPPQSVDTLLPQAIEFQLSMNNTIDFRWLFSVKPEVEG